MIETSLVAWLLIFTNLISFSFGYVLYRIERYRANKFVENLKKELDVIAGPYVRHNIISRNRN
jgi:hypothetical protein